MEEEILKYKLTFAENGAILEPSDGAALVYEEDSEDSSKNSKMCLAIGEEIYYFLYERMMNSAYYKYDIEIKITPIK